MPRIHNTSGRARRGPTETEHPSRLGEVTVVADQDPDVRERSVEGREPEVARREVVLLVAARLGALRDIHDGDAGLPVLALPMDRSTGDSQHRCPLCLPTILERSGGLTRRLAPCRVAAEIAWILR